MSTPRTTSIAVAILAVLPSWTAVCGGATRAVGHTTPDLEGHLWTIWHATQNRLTHSELLSWPDGLDLLPILGGWADIILASTFAPILGITGAYNLTMALYVGIAGLGGLALGRALGLRPHASIVCGLLLQLDPATLQHLWSGRAEQVGVGVLALFLAAGLRSSQERHPVWIMLVGLTGALSLAVAWEYALMIFGLGIWLVFIAPDPASRRRIVAGGALAVALTAPAVFALATHSATAEEGRFSEEWALRSAQNALVPGAFPTWAAIRPATLPALCILALPWTARARGPRFTVGLGLGLGVALILALGPEPSWGHHPPTGVPEPWAPFTWLAQLPGLSRYQTPARLMAPWTLAAPVAAAFVVSWLSTLRSRAGLVAAGTILVVSLAEVAPVLPRANHVPNDWSAMEALARDPHPGGVYDLPPHRRAGRTIDYQHAQMIHGRGIQHHSLQPYVVTSSAGAPDPFVTWALRETGPPTEAALASLKDRHFGFVVVHAVTERGYDAKQVARRLSASWGPPVHSSPHWQAWRVE